MPSTNSSECDRDGGSACIGGPRTDARQSDVRRLGQVILLAIGAYFCYCSGLFAQKSDSQATEDANKSWRATTASTGDNVNRTRTIESHSQSGNRTVDKQSFQIRDLDGHLQPYRDLETETVQVYATTVRTTTRAFAQDATGTKTLVQQTEEEKHSLPGGGSGVVRVTSSPDVNRKLQVVQREVGGDEKDR